MGPQRFMCRQCSPSPAASASERRSRVFIIGLVFGSGKIGIASAFETNFLSNDEYDE